MFVTYRLKTTLKKLDITKNTLAVESKVRPNTIADIASGNTKSINIKTLVRILTAINEIAEDKGFEPNFGIEDIVLFEHQSDFSDLTEIYEEIREEDLGLSRDKSRFYKTVEKTDFVYKNEQGEEYKVDVKSNSKNQKDDVFMVEEVENMLQKEPVAKHQFETSKNKNSKKKSNKDN